MGYLKIARELLNSSFWRSLAPAEKGILTDLMAMATYKPRVFNMNGYDVQLDCLEICISINSYAKSQGLDRSYVTRLIENLESWSIVRKEVVYLSKIATNKTTDKTTKDVTSKKCSKLHSKVTLLSFNEWIFAMDSDYFAKYPPIVRHEQSNPQSEEQTCAQHNKEVLKKEVLNENIKKNSACAVPSFESSKSLPYKKTWYSMEEIAELNFAYADEIMADWKEYSGRSEKEVREKLSLFAKKKLRVGQSKMTLDVFDKEFRKEMKSAFALKSKQKNEPERELYYYGEDD